MYRFVSFPGRHVPCHTGGILRAVLGAHVSRVGILRAVFGAVFACLFGSPRPTLSTLKVRLSGILNDLPIFTAGRPLPFAGPFRCGEALIPSPIRCGAALGPCPIRCGVALVLPWAPPA